MTLRERVEAQRVGPDTRGESTARSGNRRQRHVRPVGGARLGAEEEGTALEPGVDPSEARAKRGDRVRVALLRGTERRCELGGEHVPRAALLAVLEQLRRVCGETLERLPDPDRGDLVEVE